MIIYKSLIFIYLYCFLVVWFLLNFLYKTASILLKIAVFVYGLDVK
jgi:hypothetical protein